MKLPWVRGGVEVFVEETATGDAREDATLKIARTARKAGAVRNIIGICGHGAGAGAYAWAGDSVMLTAGTARRVGVGRSLGCMAGIAQASVEEGVAQAGAA